MKNNIASHLQSLAFYIVFMSLAVAGLVYHQAESMNVLKLFSAAIGLLMFISGFSKDEKRQKIIQSYRSGEHLPKWIDVVCYGFMILILAAFGHFVLAGFWLVAAGTDLGFRMLASEEKQ